jgi:hypothetical protein
MVELKPISEAAIPRAIAKAERYRLLGEPEEADSICRDILSVAPNNQEVLVMLLLAITDQFGGGANVRANDAQRVLRQLTGEYERAYYAGIICERWAKAHLQPGEHAGSTSGWILEAMDWYRKAEELSPPGNDDAILRWNACVRFLERNPELMPTEMEQGDQAGFSDAMPPR